MERELTESNKPELLNLLSKVSDKWKRLGVQLELSSTLSTITEGDPRNSMMEMITEWLKGNGNQRTPKALAEALKSDSVGEPRLAESLEKKYGKTVEMESVTEGQSSPGPETPCEKPKQAEITPTANKRGNSSNEAGGPSPKKPKQDTSEVEPPAEILYKSCQDHVFKCEECRERLLKTNADKQNNIQCKNAPEGCDWRGKSIEEQDAHTAVCPKQGVQCPFVEEFRCRYAYFRREKLNDHLQHHITSLHTQIKTCQCQIPPIVFTIPQFRSNFFPSQKPKEYKFPFYTCRGGYLMRLCISIKSSSPDSQNPYFELSMESMPGSYDDRLPPWPSTVTIKGRMYESSETIEPQEFKVNAKLKHQDSPKKCTNPRNYDLKDFYSQHIMLKGDEKFHIEIVSVETTKT